MIKDNFTRTYGVIGNPKGCICVVHGIGEHSGYYLELGEYFNSLGFVVSIMDLRGHGFSGDQKMIDFGRYPFEHILNDLDRIVLSYRKDYPGSKIFLFGHSLGSMITRVYLQNNGIKINGAILSGAPYMGSIINCKISHLFTSVISLFKGKDQANLLLKLIFKGVHSRYPLENDYLSWLSRDENHRNLKRDDKLCNLPISNRFLNALAKLNVRAHRVKTSNLDTSILLISGDDDGISNLGKDSCKLYEKYKKHGQKDVSIKIFEGMRHEVISEIGKEDVFSLMGQWIIERG